MIQILFASLYSPAHGAYPVNLILLYVNTLTVSCKEYKL